MLKCSTVCLGALVYCFASAIWNAVVHHMIGRASLFNLTIITDNGDEEDEGMMMMMKSMDKVLK